MVLFQRMALWLPGEFSWESSPPWSCISHAVAASPAGSVSLSGHSKPGHRCKPISISLSAPPSRERPSGDREQGSGGRDTAQQL